MVDGTVVFRDTHHVTATYMAMLAEPIGNLLEGRAPYPSPRPVPSAESVARRHRRAHLARQRAPLRDPIRAHRRVRAPLQPPPAKTDPRNRRPPLVWSGAGVGSDRSSVASPVVPEWGCPRCIRPTQCGHVIHPHHPHPSSGPGSAGGGDAPDPPPCRHLGAEPPDAVLSAEWAVLSEMNRVRDNQGLAPLRMAEDVREVARERSRSMKRLDYFGHVSPCGVDAGDLLASTASATAPGARPSAGPSTWTSTRAAAGWSTGGRTRRPTAS